MFIVEDKNGFKVKWENGRFSSNDQDKLSRLREVSKRISQTASGVSLNGCIIGAVKGADFEKNEYTAYALLETVLDIVKRKGDIPSAKKLFGTEEMEKE